MQLESYVDTPAVTGSNGGVFATLAADYTSGATSLVVSSNAPYGAADPTASPPTIIYVRIDNEVFLVTDNRTTTWTVAGAQQGSTAANHSGTGGTAKTVYQVLTIPSMQRFGIPLSTTLPFLPNLDGVRGAAWGHSYVSGSGATNTSGYVTRLVRDSGLATVTNNGVGGDWSFQTALKILATTTAFNEVNIVDCFINDVLYNPNINVTSGQNLTQNSLRTIIECLLAGSGAPGSAGSHPIPGNGFNLLSGTWTTTAAASGMPAYAKTTTAADFADVYCWGDTFTVIMQGYDDTKAGVTGAAFAIDVDGVASVATGTCSNAGSFGGATPINALGSTQGFVPLPVRFTGMGPGWHYVKIRHTGTTGQQMGVFAAVSRAFNVASGRNNPPYVLIVKDVPLVSGVPSAGYLFTTGGANGSDAKLAAVNALVDTEVTAVGNTALVDSADPTVNVWTPATDLGVDGLHPNDVGHRKFLVAVVAKLTAVAARYGVNAIRWTDFLGSAVTATYDPSGLANATTIGPGNWSDSGSWTVSNNSQGASFSIASGKIKVVNSHFSLGALLRNTNRLSTSTPCGSWAVTFGTVSASTFVIVGSDSANSGGGSGLGGNNLRYFPNTGNVTPYNSAGTPSTTLTPVTGANTTATTGDTIKITWDSTGTYTVFKNGTQVATYSNTGTRYNTFVGIGGAANDTFGLCAIAAS